jgi:ribosomal protein S27E
MSLSARLRHADLTVECRYCGRPLTKKGSWFLAVHRFKCEGCNRETPITYSDKIVLFKKHAAELPLTAPTIGYTQDRNREKSEGQLQSPPAKAPRLVAYAGRGGLHNQNR